MIALTCGTSTGLRARAVESTQLSAVAYFCGLSGGTASGLAGERLESCSAERTASRMALSSNSLTLVLPVRLSLVDGNRHRLIGDEAAGGHAVEREADE